MRHLLLALALVGCSGKATPPTAAPNKGPAVSNVEATSKNSPPRAQAKLRLNCLPPLTVVEEVSRFLTRVATHATRSDTCIDGEGIYVSIDELRVCGAPGSTSRRRTYEASFRVTSSMTNSGRIEDGADPPPVSWVEHATFAFSPKGGGYVIDPAVVIASLADSAASSPTAPHDGECHGRSKPFVPEVIEIP